MSQIFADSAHFEALFTRMFEQIESDDPSGMDGLSAQSMVIHFRIREPDVDLWVDGRTSPVVASFGPVGPDPSLTASLTGNSLHELLLGTLPLGRALMLRKLKVDGAKSKAMKLESLLHAMQAVYPGLVEELLGNGAP